MRIASCVLAWLLLAGTVGAVEKIDDAAIAKLPAAADTVVINFWATWCEPCIEEIPLFVKLHEKRPDLKIIGISMDDPDQAAEVDQFARQRRMKYRIVMRQGEHFEAMVNSMDPEWIGGLPATFVFKNGRRTYTKVGQITEKELQQAVSPP